MFWEDYFSSKNHTKFPSGSFPIILPQISQPEWYDSLYQQTEENYDAQNNILQKRPSVRCEGCPLREIGRRTYAYISHKFICP